MPTGKKTNLFNFGKSWGIIIYCLLLFWLQGGMVNDGTNIIAPAVANKLGVPVGNIIGLGTIAGIAAVVSFILFGILNRKIGPRYVSGICLLLAGAGYIGVGSATSVTMYAIFLCITASGATSAAFIAGGPLVAQWFPKKKGIVMGYTTMGLNFATALYVPMIAALVSILGIEKAVIVPVIMAIALAIVGAFFIRNTPMDVGLNPDNVSNEIYEKEYFTEKIDRNAGWTVMKLLKEKNYWLAAITTGTFQLITTIIIVQMVVRNQEFGFSLVQAITTMSVLAVVGVFGSWLVGAFDTMFGTKKVMIAFGIFYMVALLFNFTGITTLFYISLVMLGFSIGGSANFMVSLPSAVFGRHGFETVNSVIFPLQSIIACLSFGLVGIIVNLTGGVRYTYLAAAIICGLNILLITLVDEHKYNRDYMKEA